MSYERRIVHYGPDLTGSAELLSDRAIAGCWFELHRQGGCGSGELQLRDEFANRAAIEIGDWIACEVSAGERWYLGRVQQRQARSPARVSYRLEGMSVELGEVFPGGFSRAIGEGTPPHRYGCTDLFSFDPDHAGETADSAARADEVVRLLLNQYVIPRTHIQYDPELVESVAAAAVTTLKFRGEESVRSVMKELAIRAGNASWGVGADGKFYFLQRRPTVLATYREGTNLLSLEETRDLEMLYNRVVLTGDYVYNAPLDSGAYFRGFYRWRGNYVEPHSRALYGERRIRLWIPWIRTQADSLQFVREFFRVYAHPISRFQVEAGNQLLLPRPWLGRIRLESRTGAELITAQIETVRVQFDHAPQLRMEVGPEDPHTHWPEPPQDERWEIPGVSLDNGPGGGLVSLTPGLSFDPPGSSSSDSVVSSSSSDWDSSLSVPASSASESTEDSSSAVSSESESYSSSAASSSSEESSSGSSSGTWTATTSDGLVNSLDCCPETGIPNYLWVVLSAEFYCECLTGAFALHFQRDLGRWVGSGATGCGQWITLHLFCFDTAYFKLEIFLGEDRIGEYFQEYFACEPFHISFSTSLTFGAYCDPPSSGTVWNLEFSTSP